MTHSIITKQWKRSRLFIIKYAHVRIYSFYCERGRVEIVKRIL